MAVYLLILEQNSRERTPLVWAMTQCNLGLALLRLGERESGTARLEEAVTCFRLSLEERTRERVPLEWAVTQTNLASALAFIGERAPGTAQLEEAAVALREARGVFEAAHSYHYAELVAANIKEIETVLAGRRPAEPESQASR